MNEQRSQRHSHYDRRWLILAILLCVECMDLLDSTVVNTALPSLRTDLGSSLSAVQWIAGGYSLTYAVGLVTGGRLGDLYGRRRIIGIGLVGFVAASVICGLAPSTGVLIAARLVQGAFAAVMIPQGFGIIKEVFGDEAGQAFGLFGPVIGLAAILGPIIGGSLVDLDLFGAGWRLVFLVNVPFGAAALLGCLRVLPESKASRTLTLDITGMTLVTGAATLLVYPLIQGREAGWPAWTFVAMGAGAVVFAVFGAFELRRTAAGRDALVQPSIFTRAFSGGLVVLFLFFCGMTGTIFVFGLYLQIGEGFSAIHAGLTFLPWMLGLSVGAGLGGGWLGPKYGRAVVQGGSLLMIGGLVWLIATVHAHPHSITSLQLAPPLVPLGAAMGVALTPVFDIVLAGVAGDEVGSASGVMNAIQQLSAAMGVAILGTIFFSVVSRHGFAEALQRTLWVEVGVMASVVLASPLMPRRAREENPAQLAPAVAPPSVSAQPL